MNRASRFLSFHPSALKTLRLAALFQCSLYLSLRVSGREMYLPVRTVCSLNSPIRAMWNGMFKLYWCHIHDPHTSQQQQSLCDFTDNKNTTHEEQVFVSLLYLGQTARQCMSALITGELCRGSCVEIRNYQINTRQQKRLFRDRQDVGREVEDGKEMAQRQKACKTSSHLKRTNTQVNYYPYKWLTAARRHTTTT